MDRHLLVHVLSNTFNPDATIRHQSEAHLAQLEVQPGYPSSLLHIAVVLPPDQLPIKQAALLRLKHHIQAHWDVQKREAKEEERNGRRSPLVNPLTQQDRSVIRDNIYEATLHQSSPLLRVQLLESVSRILKVDWPHAWPALLPSILSTLRCGDPQRMSGALLVLSLLYKGWAFVEPKRREAMVDPLTAEVMPVLLPIFQHVSTQDSNDAYEMLHVLTKIFFHSVRMRVSPYLRSPSHALPFFQLLILTLQRPVPPQLLLAFTSSSRLPPDKHPLWKAKKWSMQTLTRTFSRWGQAGQVKEKAMRAFAAFYTTKVAPAAFTAIIGLLKGKKEGHWLSHRVCHLSYVYLSNALRVPDLRRLMQKNLPFLLNDVILPILCLTPDDIRLFLTDPHEFIRQSLDLMEEYHDPRVAACNLLIDLVKVDSRRQSNEALALSLQLIGGLFAAHAERRDNEEAIVLKEGAMRMLGALRAVLMKDEAMHPTIESLLSQFVLPELSSPHGFVRSRALQLLGRYSRLEWQDKQRHANSIILICQCLLPSNALPVRLDAASAISRLVRNEDVLSFIQSQIPLVFSTFFDLMDEIGNEEVISTMQMLLGRIGEDVEPYAAEVVGRLSRMCLQLLHSPEDDDESALAAAEALRTISAVFYALQPKPAVIIAIEPLTHPVIAAVCLSSDDSKAEFFEDGVELVHCIIDTSSHISPFLSRAFPVLVSVFYSWATDYLQHIAALTDLYTARGGEGFVRGSKVVTGEEGEEAGSGLDVVMKLILFIWKGGETQPETDTRSIQQQYACKMMESVLAHHRGEVDHLLPLLLRLVTTLLLSLTSHKEKKQHLPLILSLLDVVSALCYYNPAAFLSLLEGARLTQAVFNVWMSYVDSEAMTTSFHHLRMAIIAMSSLSCLSLSSLPALLREAMPDVVTLQLKRLVRLIEMYKIAEEEEKQEEEEWEKGEEEEEDEYEGELWDDEEEDEKQADAAGGKEEAAGEEEEENETASSLRQWEDYAREHDQNEVDETHFPSPLDDVNEFVAFAEQMERLKEKEPAWYRKYENGLKKEKKVGAAYEAVMDKAKEMREKQEEERGKEAEDGEKHGERGDEEKKASV